MNDPYTPLSETCKFQIIWTIGNGDVPYLFMKPVDAINFRLMLCNHGNPAKSKTITKEDSSPTGRISSIVLSNNNKLQQNDSNPEL